MHAGVSLLDTDVMPICIIIALDIVITLCFSINCSTVIFSPTVLFAFKSEKPLVKPMPPGSIFLHIFSDLYTKNTLLQFIYFTFILCFSNLLYLSLSDLTFANDREGIDNPFIA